MAATYALTLLNAEGLAAEDPAIHVDFIGPAAGEYAGSATAPSPPALSLSLDVFPAGHALQVALTPSLYRNCNAPQFIPQEGVTATPPPFTLLRDPAQWQPVFQPLARLDASFQALLTACPNVALKNGSPVGNLSVSFDNLAGPPAILAKMALLNIYSVLRDQMDPVPTTPTAWISFVKSVLMIDQERFVSVVDQALYADVQTILGNLGRYGAATEANASILHGPNFTAAGYPDAANIITIKLPYEQGNVQFTMAQATRAGEALTLLDCDMDEHLNIVEHTFDLLDHIVTGGTNPVDMHEYIVYHSAQQNHGPATVQLGYSLQAVAAPAAARAAAAGR